MMALLAGERMKPNHGVLDVNVGYDQLTCVKKDGWLYLHMKASGKWYESFPEVQAWTTLLDGIEDGDGELEFAYVRIGEEDGYIERRYHGDSSWDLLGIERSIVDEVPTGETIDLLEV